MGDGGSDLGLMAAVEEGQLKGWYRMKMKRRHKELLLVMPMPVCDLPPAAAAPPPVLLDGSFVVLNMTSGVDQRKQQ